MVLVKTILVLYILPFIDVTIYIYNTADSSSTEFYDCILHADLFYCRRPNEPIILNRSNDTKRCYHNGILHSFANLNAANVSISTVLHQWKSSLEKVEHYSRYMTNLGQADGYVCECTNPQSFGKNCEYLLSVGITFAETLRVENELKINNPNNVQLYGDIICYITLKCDSGLLCLDWRDICDGVQQCMLGFDEENCDKLEFNECDNDEYRCMNGMCIPDEYFLDGEFDCLDWSDEIQYYDDKECAIEEASIQCDDRICPPNQWSCGDGQCIFDRFYFQTSHKTEFQCQNRREQYFICETNLFPQLWTISNGRCYEGWGYEELNMNNRTKNEQCQYLLKCALSSGAEKHCPCAYIDICARQLNAICPSNYIQYPQGTIVAPYLLIFFDQTTDFSLLSPSHILINGTIKCKGILTNISDVLWSYIFPPRELEQKLCREANYESILDDYSYDQRCDHHMSLTFNNHSYSSSDVCNESNECISTYRIKDGIINCIDKMDESSDISFPTIYLKVQRYRFRCSIDELTYLSVITLGNLQNDCKNAFDELWMGTSTKLVDTNCNRLSNDQCKILRQYIEKSWTLNSTNEITEQLQIPFRQYCDTFWDLVLGADENVNECRDWWICSEEQWQCNSGQCIDKRWVLDGEWDCVDASDEDSLFSRSIPDRNLQLTELSTLISRFIELNMPTPFSTICNVTTEFPCFPINVSIIFHNLTFNRPCINRHQIGDGHIDCYGAIDERNTIQLCHQPTMLGYNFKCMSTHQCIPYWKHCLIDRCDTSSDDRFWCDLRRISPNCNDFSDSVCFNGTCVKRGRCDRIPQCSFGEDEYMCDYENMYYESISKWTDIPYRKEKHLIGKNIEQKPRLVQFPINANTTKPLKDSSFVTQTTLTTTISMNTTTTSLTAYWCNRGVGVEMYNNSIICFCSSQYYGDKCQFYNDRIILLLHLNLSQSIYTVDSEIQILLKIVVLFLFKNEIIMNHIFHVRPVAELFVYTKKIIHFLYSRSSEFLQHKRERYFNLSDILNHSPYSIRIEMYETKETEKLELMAVWQYPIYFDYLPVFRLAKVLHLAKLNLNQTPCSSNPCNHNQQCQQLLSEISKYICLCKSNFGGENCSIEDHHCIDNYCAFGSICKPNYRGLLIGNQQLPFCICSFNRFGEQCDVQHDQCLSNPCQHNGSCFPTSKPDSFSCFCTEQYYGKRCELSKSQIKLYINESVNHAAAVVQYFSIDFTSLSFNLAHQRVYRTLPTLIEYRHGHKTAPEIILIKLYSSQIEHPAQLYLISVQTNVTWIYATIQVIETNECVDVLRLMSDNETQVLSNYYPIRYHYVCRNDTNLLCFKDDSYLCICSDNHSRVECFRYDYQLDQCSYCLSGGRCLKADQFQPQDFLCLCPSCYSGTKCQFNSKLFTFTLDQLFFTDLNSDKQQITVHLLIISPLLLFFIALPSNFFCLVTFRRRKCLSNGIGHYLLCICIVNQINLGFLAARLIHLAVCTTGFCPDLLFNNVVCRLLNYSLTCSTRIVGWLAAFVAIERVYAAVFLTGKWLKSPHIARRFMALIFFVIFASAAYELVFVESLFIVEGSKSTICVVKFPLVHQSVWVLVHQMVSIMNSMLPLFINFCCTITIVCIIVKKKMNIYAIKKCKLTRTKYPC